jgi:type IV pilus assembly protein PilE
MKTMHRTAGFTLIELMIVVAIIAILAAIAYPSYREHVRKTRRADCEGALMGLANVMERRFTENGSYCDAGTTASAGCGTAAGDTGAPLSTLYSSRCPVDGGTKSYDLTISAVTQTTYTLQAAPAGPQIGDKCGTLTLDQTGAKGINGAAAGMTAAACWQ